SDQAVDHAACSLVPEQRPIWIARFALPHQGAGEIEQRVVETRQTLDQTRLKRAILGRGEREPAWIDLDQDCVDARVGIGRGVGSCWQDRQRSGWSLVR